MFLDVSMAGDWWKCRGQNDIFYITGESIAGVSSSPFLETLRKKGIEVLYMAGWEGQVEQMGHFIDSLNVHASEE